LQKKKKYFIIVSLIFLVTLILPIFILPFSVSYIRNEIRHQRNFIAVENYDEYLQLEGWQRDLFHRLMPINAQNMFATSTSDLSNARGPFITYFELENREELYQWFDEIEVTAENIVSIEPYLDNFQFGFFSNYTIYFSRDIRILIRDYIDPNTAHLIERESALGTIWRTAFLTGYRNDAIMVMTIKYRYPVFHW